MRTPRLPDGSLRGILLVLLVTLLAAAGLRAQARPRGRLVWTEATGSGFEVKTTVWGPDGRPMRAIGDIDGPGATVAVDAQGMFARYGTRLQDGATFAADAPRGTLKFLHPALDFTGRRLLFVSGESSGPDSLPPETRTGSPSSLSSLSGGTALYFALPDQQVTQPDDSGGVMDAFPTADPQGKTVYFSRFHYQPGSVDMPGWYLMQAPREDFEAGSGADFLVDQSGQKVRGSQPSVTPSGEYLLFVRRDHRNLSTDLWYLRLPADENQAEKLFEAEGEPDYEPPEGKPESQTTALDLEDWIRYTRFLGRARISHPVMDSATRFVVYACDRGADARTRTITDKDLPTWDLYTLEVTRAADGTLTPASSDEPVSGASEPGVDEMWPTVSGDGRFAAFVSKENPAATAAGGGDPGPAELKTVGLEIGQGPGGDVNPVEGAGTGTMWPVWDQDEDPPHVLITLRLSDGSPPTVLRILDEDPDPSAASDVFELSLEMRGYHPSIPPPPGDMPSGFEPIVIRAPIQNENPAPDEPLRLEYLTPETNSLLLLLCGDREEVGDHVGMKKLLVPTNTPGQTSTTPFTHPVLTSDDFMGISMFENVRLEIQVLARDNRWKRVGPAGPQASLYDSDPAVEARQLFPEDERATPNPAGEAESPYLDRVGKDDSMNGGKPGYCWWVEEASPGSTSDSDIEEGRPNFENAPYILFRNPNYPHDEVRDPKDRYLRIVIRDLLSNTVDLRIPLYVLPKDFEVSTLSSDTQRRR